MKEDGMNRIGNWALGSLMATLFIFPLACNKTIITPSVPNPGPGGATSTPTSSATNTSTATILSTPSETPTVTPILDCNVTTTLNLAGNLDAGLQVNQPGGIFEVLDINDNWVLPFDFNYTPSQFNKIRLYLNPGSPGGLFLQLSDLTTPLDVSSLALPHHTTVV